MQIYDNLCIFVANYSFLSITLLEIKEFAKEATEVLKNLNFQMKRAIIAKVVDKAIGTQQSLKITGQVPIAPPHVVFNSIHRYCRLTERGKIYTFQGPDK